MSHRPVFCVAILAFIPFSIEVNAHAAVTTRQDAAGGCDGVKTGRWGFHVASGQQDPWWQVDLGEDYAIDRIVVFNRTKSQERTSRLRILATDTVGGDFREIYQHDGRPFGGVGAGTPLTVEFPKDGRPTARIVRLAVTGNVSLALDEIEIYAADAPDKNIALKKPADQISVSQFSRFGTASDADFAAIGFPPVRGGHTNATQPDDTTEDALARCRALIERFVAKSPTSRFDAFSTRVDALEDQLATIGQQERADQAAGRLRQQVLKLKREIALANPLLDFDKLLFIKRHTPTGPFHMCDQYYGCNAVSGGGLFVLENAFGGEPRLVNLLENSVVENGRLKGQRLDEGSFLSPELSFDGETILFAYSEAKAKRTYQWAPEYCYHIFKVNVDGTGLTQLTDGPYDDFDPCFLPDGRIAFVSLRRGGYLRCGRHCPVYTLHSMEPDGSDIVCISFHETHEWQPSVNNDGMLVYTRWDYVDRDTNVAHHIWLSYPDGRDPRSYHGNYPIHRSSRPWMEMSIRAIPHSHKYVATAAAHHGHAFGSLVLIDQRLEDDGAMSQLTRLTPDCRFPEAEGGKGGVRAAQQYGTAWPLSEEDFLCVYDANSKNRGIYWIDAHGNKELIYRDPEISCLSPIPLRPRPTPPVIPDATTQTAAARESAGEQPATISVMNVYDSDFEWPEETKIESLRVIQVLPKTTAPPNQPRIGVANQTNARAVLGTVPVEADGSAHFVAPVGKAIYFQAVDERGLAIQSMRSATYVHPGEQLSCQGCHERKRRASPPIDTPLALKRRPSKIAPDVDGSSPFNYVRLVQPALDRNCVDCHAKEKALDLTGVLDGNGFTRSYNNLAGKYGFYFNVGNGSINDGTHGGSRGIAGKFGARAAPLMKYLDKSHHGVRLSDEDFHRVTLWLDCNSEFLGAYENAAAQARGEIVKPSLD
jgi:hypothetical protein